MSNKEIEALDIAEKQELTAEQATSYRALASINHEEGNTTLAISNCRKSMEICELLGDRSGVAKAHNTIALAYRTQGSIDKALEHHHESLRIKQEYGADDDDIANSYFNLGTCYSILHHFDQAQSFYENALEIWEKSDNPEHLAHIYNNIGCFYGRKKELVKAREYLQKSLDILDGLDDKKGIARTLNNFGNLFRDLGDNESALDFYIRSLVLYEEINNRREIAHVSSCIGGIYTTIGRLEEAEELILRSLKIANELKFKDREILSLEKLVDLYKAKGDLGKALMYSQEKEVLLEEYLNEKSMEKIVKMQVQFETEKKEKEAEIYRLKNVELSGMNDKLREALADVKKLQGMLPICSNCKKVRDDDGYWQQIESYISERSETTFSHGICPECFIELYGKVYTREKN